MKKIICKALIVLLVMGPLVTYIRNIPVSASETNTDIEDLPPEHNNLTEDDINIEESGTEVDEVEDSRIEANNDDIYINDSIPDDMDKLLNNGYLDIEDADSIPPEIPDTQYNKHFYFEYPKVMKEIFSTSAFYFNIPDYWELEYVYVGVAYDVSRLVTGKVPATMTFLINGTPIYSCYIRYERGQTQMAYFEIPVTMLKSGFNILETSSFVRLYEYEGCTENQSWANWVIISADSYIYAGYGYKDSGYRISDYPFPFITSEDTTGNRTGVIVSDNASNGELAAALYLLADISKDISGENEITFGRYSEVNEEDINRRIMISTTGNLPDKLKGYLQEDMKLRPEETHLYDLSSRTMVRLVEDEVEGPIVLIVSDKEANLMEAIHMLMDEDRVSQEKGSIAFVAEGSGVQASEAAKLSQMVAGSYTIKDITGGGIKFIGPFHNEHIIFLPFGKDYVLSSAGNVTLKFRYSENLDFNRSLITVYWGDTPVASKKLTQAGAASDELTFTMPADVVGTGASSIKIAFDLEIRDLICTMSQDEMPWAYVTEDSVLYLPAGDGRLISFDYIPSPFQNRGRFDNVLIVVSDEFRSIEMALLGKAMTVYANRISPYGSLKVIRAGEFDEADADYNIITVGTLTNGFLSILNESLHFKLKSTGEAFESNNRLVLSESYAHNIATFQLIESPYEPSRGIFVIAATGGVTLKLAYDFLRDQSNHGKLSGDCVIVDRDFDVRSFIFNRQVVSENKPTLEEFIRTNKQPIIFTVMAAAAMIMLLTASILILTRAKKYSKKED